MSGKVFIDTNVFVYGNDRSFPEKQKISRARVREVFGQGLGVISTQVLHEFYTASIRKLGLPATEVRKQVEGLLAFEIIDIDVSLIKEAIDCSILDQINYWDALMVICAQRGMCGEIWTEDLNDGQMIQGVKIVNIFKQRREK